MTFGFFCDTLPPGSWQGLISPNVVLSPPQTGESPRRPFLLSFFLDPKEVVTDSPFFAPVPSRSAPLRRSGGDHCIRRRPDAHGLWKPRLKTSIWLPPCSPLPLTLCSRAGDKPVLSRGKKKATQLDYGIPRICTQLLFIRGKRRIFFVFATAAPRQYSYMLLDHPK